ncbi:MAG: hypothetical protein K2N26_05850 [Oscillospiraceae bacterium]|nr:hypothetical protein [Oscillospiraceae bacterium]MDE7279232.1 hypothetical protein [Oscillospiraceae bacterium]
MKKKNPNRLYILSAVLFIAVAAWFVVSVNNADSAAGEKRSQAVYNSIMNGASLCYSIEGEYPPDLEYLEKNYGIRVNSDKYIVDYSYFGANIRPTVTVIEKEGAK